MTKQTIKMAAMSMKFLKLLNYVTCMPLAISIAMLAFMITNVNAAHVNLSGGGAKSSSLTSDSGNSAATNSANILIPTTDSDNTVSADNDAKYNFYYHGQTIRQVLISYAKNQGMRINFVGDELRSKLTSAVSGRFSVYNADDLLNILAKQYGFMWFNYLGELYITNNMVMSKSIEVSPEDMPMLKANLQNLNLLNQQFGYSELPAENKVIISGPRAYVDLVLRQIKSLHIAPTLQQFAVYRLKYASASDVQLMFNNQQINIPGVATILQSLVQGGGSVNSGNKIISRVTEPIRNQLNKELGQLNSNNNDKSIANNGTKDAENIDGGSGADKYSSSGNGSISAANIQADPRLNTIVIRDKTPNLKIYKQLIELLDVPAPLIQVDVLIIRLDQDKLNQAGINWWNSSGGSGFGFGAANLNSGIGNPSNAISFYYGQITPGQLLVNNLDNFVSSLQFLEQHNLAQTVSHPSLATTDNLPAIISTNQNLYVGGNNSPSGVPQSNGSGNNLSNAWQTQITNGLQITPHVIVAKNGKNEIKLSIVLDDGTISDQSYAAMPNTTQSTITSQAIIKEGQSILLAGYTKTIKQEVKTQVPYLGAIPLLGWFFKSSSVENRQVSTLYLVTPRIVWMNDMLHLGKNALIDGRKVDINTQYHFVNESAEHLESAEQATTAKMPH